ncbi:hypothetical protein KEM56_001332, partial [Ascosphaera pollenicola]
MAAVVDRGRDRLRDHSSWDFAVPLDPIDPEELKPYTNNSDLPQDTTPYKEASPAQRSAPVLSPPNGSPAPRGRNLSAGIGGASRSRSNTQNGKALMSRSASREPSTNRLNPGNTRANVRGNSPKRPPGSSKLAVDTSKMTAKQSEDYWIHRDKLAKIESQELQQWGIQLPTSKQRKGAGSRAESRASSRHRQRTDESTETGLELEQEREQEPDSQRQMDHGQRSNANTPDGKMYLSSEGGSAEGDEDHAVQYTAEPEELGHTGDHDDEESYGNDGDGEGDDQYPNGLASFTPYNRNISTPTGQDYASLPSSAPGSGPTSPYSDGARKASSKKPISRLPVPATASLNERPSTGSRIRANTANSTDALTGRARSRQNSSHQRINTAGSNTSASASGGSRGSNSTSNSPEPSKEVNGKAPRGRNSRPLSTGSVPAK